MRFKNELDVPQSGYDYDFTIILHIVFQTLNAELEHEWQDLDHRGILILCQEDLISKRNAWYELSSAELGHPHQ